MKITYLLTVCEITNWTGWLTFSIKTSGSVYYIGKSRGCCQEGKFWCHYV